jgi:hypothetical protein
VQFDLDDAFRRLHDDDGIGWFRHDDSSG